MDNVDEALKYAIEHGMIDLSYLRKQVKMNKREELFKKHKGKIWQGKDGYWYTKLPQGSKKRLVKKNTYEKIKDAVIAYYVDENNITFKKRYAVWVERQKMCGRSDNTIYKYQKDYERFFAGYEIESTDIREISDETICRHINGLLEEKEIPWKTLIGMFGYLSGVFRKSIIDKVIESNPCDYVDLAIFRRKSKVRKVESAKERTLSKTEMQVLSKKTKNAKRPSIQKLAVELAMYTGMRVGEISALRWDDIIPDEKIIVIRHSEVYSRIEKKYSIDSTKNGRVRAIPITKEIENLLLRTKELEIQTGNVGEYVFMKNGCNLHAKSISECMRKLTRTKEFECEKSIHAIRRTINSNMRCNGVSAAVAASMLGHTERVNENNYTYDVTGNEFKRSVLESAYLGN